MKCENIKVGDYIIVQRQLYRKLHKFNNSSSKISLGKDVIDLTGIEGKKYSSIFKMIPNFSVAKRSYTLDHREEIVELKDEIDIKESGLDNRNIFDDGNSQKLSAAAIHLLRDEATKASDIVETLISNSNTFKNKTEYSQDKYLKKKEKKYFEYIQVIRPNIRMIAEILYKLEPTKIQGLRIDTLSQIITMSNVYSNGIQLLYDSGSNGLVAASLLSSIGSCTSGNLLHLHPGNMSQKQALLAMNFPQEQMDRCLSVNVYSVLRQFYQGCDTNITEKPESKVKESNDDGEPKKKIAKIDTDSECKEPKKPKWHYDNIAASKLLEEKVDSLIIATKEDPQNIFQELMNFVKPGRPFVIYYSVPEPLQALYLSLKSDSKIAALKLTCNWMRNYQVLDDRTHPEVNMNGSSGFLLSGYILK